MTVIVATDEDRHGVPEPVRAGPAPMVDHPEPPIPPTSPGGAPGDAAPRLREVPPPRRGLREIVAHGLRVAGAARGRTVRAAAAARAAWWRLLAGLRRVSWRRPYRLHLGCGNAPLAGWVNLDFDGRPDARCDLRFRLPAADGSAALVYSEHVIEHLALEDGLALFRECRRVLADDGVLRLATPDLAVLVEAYRTGRFREQDWVTWRGHEWIDSPVRMLNAGVRMWGHLYLYDFDELARRLREAGFAEVRRVALGVSDVPGLAGLETRRDSTLVVEARGRA